MKIDENNALTHIIYPGQTETNCYRFEYEKNDGLLTAKTEPNGNRFQHIFDENGKVKYTTDDENGRWDFARTVSDSGNITTTVTTGEGNTTTYVDMTDSTGKFTSDITGADGSVSRFEESAGGLKVHKETACGKVLDIEYDLDPEYKYKYEKQITETNGTLEQISSRTRAYTKTDEDITAVTDTVTVNEKETRIENNVANSVITLTSPANRTVTSLYNPDTLQTTKVSIPGLNDTDYEYYADGRLKSVTTGARESSFTYSSGNLASATTPDNQTTLFDEYDAVGRLKQVRRPDNSIVRFDYDDNGNMTILSKPATSGEVEHGFGFNNVNLAKSYTPPATNDNYSWQYDKDRRLTKEIFPSGSEIVYDYTNPNLTDETDKSRLWGIYFKDSSGTVLDQITYNYAGCGSKLASVTRQNLVDATTESIEYTYNGTLLRSETMSGTLAQTLGYEYDNDGDFRLDGFTYAEDTEAYVYDDDGLLTGAGRFTITRKAANGLPETVSDGSLNLMTRNFNLYGETDGEIYFAGAVSWAVTLRDEAGRIRQKTGTIGSETVTYDYDAMGRLLLVKKDGVLVEEYRYDSAGRRIYEQNITRGISRTTGGDFIYDDTDCLTKIGSVDYVYDKDGFLKEKNINEESSVLSTSYYYSLRGELQGVDLADGTSIEYVHDPLGRRIAKKINGTITEKYLWSGLTTLLAVYNGSDELVMRFEYADGRMPYAMTKGSNRYYLAYDQVGSLRVVANSGGSVVKRIDYDTFGNIVSDSYPTFKVPFGFAGGLYDGDTGLVRFGFRDYDPDTGRWTAKDPIRFAGGDTDLYGYCLNDPVNWVDPMGLQNDMYQSYNHFNGYGGKVNHHPHWNGGNPFTGKVVATSITSSGLFVAGTGAATQNYPLVMTGIVMTSEGAIYLAVEYVFEVDTSNLPISSQIFLDIWKGVYENWPDDACTGPLYPRSCPDK